MKRQSPTGSSLVLTHSVLALGVGAVVSVRTSNEKGVPVHSTSIIDGTYCVLGLQASLVYFVPLTQLETSRNLFKEVIQLSSLGDKMWPVGIKGFPYRGLQWGLSRGKEVFETLPAGFAQQACCFVKIACLFWVAWGHR